MDQKSEYNLDSLLSNDAFINWVVKGEGDDFWRAEIADHAHLDDVFRFAESIISNSIEELDPALVQELQSETWENLNYKVDSAPNKITSRIGLISILFILLLTFIAFYFFNDSSANTALALSNENWIEYTNNTNSNVPVDLADGSQVILEPSSYLRYPNIFDQKERKVLLMGDAFFDVARDTTKPFYIYANEAVVRVLGTSFYVKAAEDNKDVKVIVKTGKVAVYRGKEIKEYQAKKIKKVEPLIVTPNQVATLQRVDLKLNKRIISRPTLMKPLEEISKIHFEDASIHEIAEALSKAYEVEIKVSDSVGKECRLTTTLTDQPLYEKLKIICDPLGLHYMEKNVKIHITGSCGL